ncbi:MAG: tetratricopeptide repeat protein [Chitinispirillaceae bacterium]|nr:tetratricopeptide repeat protein [Chitinispirillaceae bacterium]
MTEHVEPTNPAGDASLLEELRSVYKAAPGDAQAASRLAEHYADLGWYNEALDIYREALSVHGDDFFLLLGYGNTCYRHQDRDEALAVFNTLTKLKPERIEGWNNAGIVLMTMGRIDEARSAFERVLEIESDNAGALLNLGNYHAGKGNYPEAAGLFERAIEAKPDFADAWFNLGNTCLALKDHEKARHAFERAIRYRREFPSALKNLGFVYEQCGQLEKAVETLDAASRIDKADAGIQINLANAYLMMERFDEAKNCFLKAVRLAPKNTAGWLGLRHLALLKGDIQTYMRATLAIMPRLSGGAVAKTVEILCEFNHRHEAGEVVDSADACGKGGDDLDAQRLVVYRLQNRNKSRQTALYKRLSSTGGLSDAALKALGTYAVENNDFESALRHLRRMKTADATAGYLTVRALMALGHQRQAREALEKATGQWPQNGALRFLRARLEHSEGRRDKARQYLIEALDLGFDTMDEIKKDPEMAYLFATLTAERPVQAAGDSRALDRG